MTSFDESLLTVQNRLSDFHAFISFQAVSYMQCSLIILTDFYGPNIYALIRG